MSAKSALLWCTEVTDWSSFVEHACKLPDIVDVMVLNVMKEAHIVCKTDLRRSQIDARYNC